MIQARSHETMPRLPSPSGREIALFVVAPVGSLERVPRGYRLDDCRGCGAPVWVNAEAVEAARSQGLEPVMICGPCMARP